MFEGVVIQVLAGYLGRFVKGIQKDQLKIGIWNEEVLLENVELILEAFDYLQLPFALKNGRIGKLSIKIPWKKLGWDPIIVVLEDVFICTGQRDDNEWSSDLVERRELAGKMAKLNAIELAKFSRRVSDNQAGQSFISYISAKILDNIQVSIRNVHIVYIDSHNDLVKFTFGLRFSSLTIMTDSRKQNSSGSSSGKLRGGQVNKIVEISTLALYCNLFKENPNLLDIDDTSDPQFCCDVKSDPEGYDYLVNPFDVTVSLLVNKSGRCDGAPQYAIIAELTSLVILLNEIQLQQILSLWDYFSICALREKYGRYRPSHNYISRKLNGWQRMWWHYAQESIVAGVRRKLRKTSWSNLGRRISYRRKYVNLYRRKLELLQQEQLVNKDIQHELEKMDKECEIDDILSYRSIAERQMQELLLNSTSPTVTNDATAAQVKQQTDEQLSSRARGWLNWLSLGMLGAGGTADSSSFAGVVSDEIIKDIYEATEFHPVPSFDGDSCIVDKSCLSSIKFNICQVTTVISSKRYEKQIAKATCDGTTIECKIWKDSAAIHALIDSVKIINPCNENVILSAKEAILEESLSTHVQPFINIQVKIPQLNHGVEHSVKVMLQPFETVYDSEFFLDILHFYHVLASFQFQHDRVLLSFNGFEDFRVRLLSKAEYILLTRKKFTWDVSLHNVIIKLPLDNIGSEALIMVLELGALFFKSRPMTESDPEVMDTGENCGDLSRTCLATSSEYTSLNFQLQDLYEHFEIRLSGFEVNLLRSDLSQVISVFEKFNASVAFGTCIFMDEPLLKQSEVDCIVSSFVLHFSVPILNAFIRVCDKLSQAVGGSDIHTTEVDESNSPKSFQYSVSMRLGHCSFHVDLEDDAEESSIILLIVEDIDIRYAIREYVEFWVHMKMVRADAFNSKGDCSRRILCSARNSSESKSPHVRVQHVGVNLPDVPFDESSSADGCFVLHYQARRDSCIVRHEYNMCLNDIDFHIYPRIFGLLQKLCDRISGHSISSSSSSYVEKSFGSNQEIKVSKMVSVEFSKYGFSNFCDTEQTVSARIPLDRFPFVTIRNSGYLSSLESSLIVGFTELKSLSAKDRPRSQKLNIRKMPRIFTCPALKYSTSNGTVNPSGSSDYLNLFILDLNINGVRAHFHDSSCILGIVTLPVFKSSLSFQGTDCWDILCSVEGLNLTSSWSPPNVHELLWGPVSASTSPVMNFRIRKEKHETLIPVTEISIGIQHVCCIVPPEFLAMIIGYFSLPDWNSERNKQSSTENDKSVIVENTHYDLVYKFEILNSTLVLPLERHTDYCLQLELPQLYCSFIPSCSFDDAVKDIPYECMTSVSKIADRLDIVNIFGRSTSLSLLPLRDDARLMKLDEYASNRNIPIIEQLDADFWIRIPCKAKCYPAGSAFPTLIMMKAEICNLIAEDDYFLCGLVAVGDVIDQLSSIGKESVKFKSDVLQFLQLKRSLKVSNAVFTDISSEALVNIRFCLKSLSIKFCRLKGEQFTSSQMVAKANMQFNFSVFLRNEIVQSLDVDVSGLDLHSFHSSVLLASFLSENSISSHLCINFSKSNGGKNELLLTIPFLDIWMHLSDWNEVIDLLCSYTRQLGSTSDASSGRANSGFGSQNTSEFQIVSDSESDYIMQEAIDLTVKSENIAISIHFPVCDTLSECETTEVPKQSLLSSELKNCKYIKFTLQSKDSELSFGNGYVKLKCNMEKLRTVLEMIQNHKVSSMPFIQISQVKVGAELWRRDGDIRQMFLELQVENLDMGLSHQIFNFWSCTQFKFPKAETSQIPFDCIVLRVQLKKGTLLLSDGRWSCNGPILEILMRNILVQFKQTEKFMEGSAIADLLVNYNNIDKVMWEPFIEPWSFQLNLTRKDRWNALLNTSAMTDIQLKSTEQLNLNITEALIEAIFRVNQMIKDAWNQNGADALSGRQEVLGFQTTDDMHTRRYAPYILRNDTSLPLLFHVSRGPANIDDIGSLLMKNGNIVQPGVSVPIYVEETLDEQFLRHRTAHSSERLMEKKMSSVAHHMISIQLDGTSGPSRPMSMDLVGISYFEVNFSIYKPSNMVEIERDDDPSGFNGMTDERYKTNRNNGLVVPVVFEVSMQHYSKLIRLYATVILINATSVPLELRFDIPFGVSPKILDPILPGQEFPLPLHLAEAGRMRWRPVGTDYLWSEAHSLSTILSQENRPGFLRSFLCYPSHPSSDPFRCCISIQDKSLPSSGHTRKSSSLNSHGIERPAVKNSGRPLHNLHMKRKHVIRQVRLTTPLLVKSYLPTALSLTIDCAGATHSISLSEVDAASVFIVDSTHDLGISFHMQGFRPTISKFPRAESFFSLAKLNESKFLLSETLTFYPDTASGPVCVTLEKAMDAFCGAREMCLSVPFLLYNCTGLTLTIADGNHDRNGIAHVIPSSYHLIGHEQLSAGKHGLTLVTSELETFHSNLFSKNHTMFTRESDKLHSQRVLSRHFPSANSTRYSCHNSDLDTREASLNSFKNKGIARNPLYFPGKVHHSSNPTENGDSRKVQAYMYAPLGHLPASEVTVRLCAYLPQCGTDNTQTPAWSSPFSLVPASGSTSVIIPQPSTAGAFFISVTSSPVAGELAGRTRAISFQPRYVICNACNKDLFYKQKGTNISYCLGVGQHSHLHWSDTTRELLVSIRFNEPGWQWSGCFLPDCLGDAQLKMRNYVSGALSMIRVEVQNAGVPISDEKIIENSNGNSMTQMILLSDDKTGFMPYRIDNFSTERLRIYQQRCETSETTVHSYTTCQYAWDEPCYPHRLIVEVPGERIVGTYSLDDTKECAPVYLPSTSEKPERKFYISIHAEGAIKVLSVIDSRYHVMKDKKEIRFPGFKEKTKLDQKKETCVDFTERITLHLPFFGISLINSSPQELVFACAKETTVIILQSFDQLKISFQILSMQIDNQSSDTPYPIMLSFDNEFKGRSTNYLKNKENKIQNENISPSACDSTSESVFHLAAAKWKHKDSSLVSFEYINLRLAPLCIELEEQVLLNLFDFIRTVSSRLQSRSLPKNSELWTLEYDTGALKECPAYVQGYKCRRDINSCQKNLLEVSKFVENQISSPSIPSVIPIGAPWQQIYLLARRQRKIYVEMFELAPIKLSISFSSTPWMIRNEVCSEAEPLTHINGTTFQRGLMALVDVEGVPVHLKQLTMVHIMASWESVQQIIIRHYIRQLLHEVYKVFGSAGVIGNPMGFARNVGLGIKDFLSVSSKGIVKSPAGLFTGIAQGSKSLFSNTVYAISSAATQFSKAAHKGIVAFTFDEQAVAEMEEQQKGLDTHGKGVLNEFLEGLTGLLQSPIRGAEKHGLPGVLSGIALGTAGLVARPMASILEATGKTAQSIRNRSSPHQSNRFRIRFPRPLARELPLLPYSWEEAIGVSMLQEADGSRLKDEIFVMCKALAQAGKFIVISERIVLVVWCSSLVGLGSPEFVGVPLHPEWVIEMEMSLESVVHIDRTEEVVNIVGSNAERLSRQKRSGLRNRPWIPPTSIPLFHMSVELPNKEEAEDVLQVLLSTIEQGKERRWVMHLLHRSNLR